MVEGTPLLRVHPGKTWIEGSNPSVSAKQQANKRLSGRFFVARRNINDPLFSLLLFRLPAESAKIRRFVHFCKDLAARAVRCAVCGGWVARNTALRCVNLTSG